MLVEQLAPLVPTRPTHAPQYPPPPHISTPPQLDALPHAYAGPATTDCASALASTCRLLVDGGTDCLKNPARLNRRLVNPLQSVASCWSPLSPPSNPCKQT